MPSPTATIFKTSKFSHNGNDYIVSAYTEPFDPGQVEVDVTHKGAPVVIVYPDGFKASLGYSVSFATRVDMAVLMGLSAVDQLMNTAEEDIRRLV